MAGQQRCRNDRNHLYLGLWKASMEWMLAPLAWKGEHGKPYPLTEEDHDDSAYRENGFNIFVSNNIALERSLPDIRHPNCKHKVYLEKLPNTSIIIPFHNEGWTSLLRTIHSIINRTPDSLIAEIILVDDFSDRGIAFTEKTY
ncbi:hypothetical protein Q9233_007834 [Columba guinea]|nr:hypothetical protein Q9233_007834 [Columba guinea]